MSVDLESSDNSQNDNDCKICWEDIAPGTQAELNCCKKRIYCNTCITAWLLEKQTCPFCMEKYTIQYFNQNRTLISFDRNRGTDLLDMIRRPDEINNIDENNQIQDDILNDELESTEEGSEFSLRQLQLRRPNIIDIVKRFIGLACIVLVLVLSLTPLVIYMTRSHRKD